jgi:hypothetical protein
MYGINHKINDPGLYLLSDIVEEQLNVYVKALADTPAEDKERIAQLEHAISIYQAELDKFKQEIEDQKKERFQFSVEEIYAMYGQYERKFISIEFHKYSESAQKYGRNISGIILYGKAEREALEQVIKSGNVPRTNGLVKFDSTDEHLSKEQQGQLKNEGFISGDIYEVLATNLPAPKAFGQVGKKEIPNTIEIKMDPTGFDVNRSNHWLLGQKIKSGYPLTDDEWAKFCGLSFYLEPESANLDIIKSKGFSEDGKKTYLSRFFELEAKLYAKDISAEEILEFNEFLKERKAVRIEAIVKEIKRSTNKTLEKFKEEYPEIYKALEISRIEFDNETLAYNNVAKPIYWDYEGFLHIYLRHCDELAIEGHFENKTKFQYSYKDIRRILKIAIENLLPKINDRLSQGKDFRIYGDKSLYFNGNHYSLHVLENGRIAAFHPLENPQEEAK